MPLILVATMKRARVGTTPCGLRKIGKDHRGWHVLEVDADDLATEYKVKIHGKSLHLVAQKQIMRVHVAPGPGEFDEWHIDGQCLLVAPP